jgi:para-nitrobenzyl esterase
LLFLLSVETACVSSGKEDTAVPSHQSTIVGTNVTNITRNGPIEGLEADGIYAYKGIPYAKAPVGDLRFAPPQDVEPWTTVLDCTKYGPQSVQKLGSPGSPWVADGPEQSEDILSLNVWTPAAPGTTDKLPVYVFIHGGGFGIGSGNAALYDGTSFAKNGVVMVAINYRLSTLGFFASQETYKQYGTTGNWGLLDQIKALEWVRDNIADFGGDPSQVTVGGESAGSHSVSALILSPLAKGLFRGAIMESGTILGIHSGSLYRGELQKAIESSQMLANVFGASDTAEGLKQLRTVDAGVLNYSAPFVTDQSVQPVFVMMPVYDGTVLPIDPVAALKAGNYNKVNVLVGFNRDEGNLFIPATTDSTGYEAFAARTIGKDWRRYIERFPVDENNTAAQRARQLLTYEYFSAGTKLFADALGDNTPVYLYKHDFVTPNNPIQGLGPGVYHGSEMVYAFNNLAIRGLSGKEHEKIAGEIHTRWVNFIKNGDPNVGATPPTNVTWPQYNKANTSVIVFDESVTTGSLSAKEKEDLDFTVNILYGATN